MRPSCCQNSAALCVCESPIVVMRRPAARQRPSKHVLASMNTRRIKRIVVLVVFFAVSVASQGKKTRLALPRTEWEERAS
jgi:hypothetical protein